MGSKSEAKDVLYFLSFVCFCGTGVGPGPCSCQASALVLTYTPAGIQYLDFGNGFAVYVYQHLANYTLLKCTGSVILQ